METNTQLDINNKQLRENLQRNQVEYQETRSRLEQAKREAENKVKSLASQL